MVTKNMDHGRQWSTMVGNGDKRQTMVGHGHTKKWTMVGNGTHGQPWSAKVTKDRPWLDMVVAVYTKEEYCVHRKLKWAS
ncbi:hypothetical protein DPMN_181613 [Dreissena polymorpha]|uniref:Uncharacterized protein n=1 Tax=Dreissena polymorpha TaxID=45954 RepID=A0A9D4I5H0_DREPO|nr:hypothetical protein DPMN_181613 [Dreissena polymorpha]